MKRMDDLILAYLNDQAAPEEVEQLFDWIHDNPENAKTFARAAAMHAHLRAQLSGEESVRDKLDSKSRPRSDATQPTRCQQPNNSLPARVYCFFAQPTPLSMTVAALVIGVLVTAMAFMTPPFYRALTDNKRVGAPDVETAVATITGLNGPDWGEGQPYAIGSPLRPGQRVILERGLIELTYNEDARVVLEGPVVFEIGGVGTGKLEEGKLSAQVPPSAVGFRVVLPSAEIVDLGTQFAAVVEEEGGQEIHVMQGRVEVWTEGGTSRTVLGVGEAIRLEERTLAQRIPSDASRFVAALPDDAPMPTVQGEVVVADRLPVDPETGFPAITDTPVLVRETTRMRLRQRIEVDMAAPGTWKGSVVGHVPAGTQADVYFVHFLPSERKTVTGEIEFPNRVLGIIAHAVRLSESESRLGLTIARNTEGSSPFGLDDDEIELLPDGRTVRFKLLALREDQFRVLVASGENAPSGESGTNPQK